MSKVVGIDLGTTNSLVAYVKDGVPLVIRDADGDALVPSVVSVGDDGTIYVGREAQRRLLTDAQPHRLLGEALHGQGRRRRPATRRALLPFRVGGEAGGVVRIGLGEREFTPPEISAFILRELKHRAEEFFAEQGEFDPEVDRAVITVPAYFNDAQRTATRDAGRIAGLEVLRIINEPTAASLAYGLDKRHTGVIAVYDLGGGTFDISILRVEDGVFQVLVDQRRHAPRRRRHRHAADRARARRPRCSADVALPQHAWTSGQLCGRGSPHAGSRAGDPQGGHPGEVGSVRARARPTLLGAVALTPRASSTTLIRPIVERTLAPCRQALADAGLEPSQIDEVVLVGGSTRIPLVRRLVGELFGRTPHSELNPDEVVALGAAVQADILVTGNRDMLLLDVTPLSLGIETMGGVMSKIILRNSTIPATGSEMFTTGVDNQTAVDIHVLQGERELVADNRSLARFKLRGIPPMPAGMPRVQVQFQIDANGILSVTARELRTDIEQTIEVKPSYGLTDEEVERMLHRLVRARRGRLRRAPADRRAQRSRDR